VKILYVWKIFFFDLKHAHLVLTLLLTITTLAHAAAFAPMWMR
jgi:hypothetical protein